MATRTALYKLTLVLLLAFICLPLAAQDNPLLVTSTTPFQTPAFDQIKMEHYLPAVQEGIRQQQTEIDAIVNNPEPPTFDNTILPLDMSGQLLDRATSVFYSLLGTESNPERQQLAEQFSPLLSAHRDAISHNEKLFARVKAVYDSADKSKLSGEQRWYLGNRYRNFVQSGALLDEEQKTRLREINREHSLLTLKFHDNLLAETNSSYIVIDNKEDLAGLPEGVIATGAEAAEAMNMPGKWVFTTQRPSCTPFLQYSSVRPLRQQLYTDYFMRCDRDNDFDNKVTLQKIFKLREERCRMLGYPTPAAYYLADRMAKTTEGVIEFLDRLWTPAQNRAKTERTEMQAIIDSEQAGFKLASWDWWYYAERLRKVKYELDDTALRPYFSLENVQKGAFKLCEKLYGLKFIERKDIPLYNPEIQVFEVRDADGSVLGVLYTDYYIRESKGGGAWSGSFREAFYQNGKRVIPLSTLTCNFTKPTADTPSLLSIDDVKTVFHELGHCLNTLMYDGPYRSAYSPDDIGELPSQIMENWVLEPEFLKLYAKHYQTGKVIPNELIEKLNNSVLFNQGFDAVEYIAACYLDMAWHGLEDATNVNITNFENKAMADIGLIPEILPRYRTTYFTHIQGGYKAGYYVYYWAGVLDADAFEAFKETSLFDKKTAALFRENILEKLGTGDAMTLYRNFRGHEPDVNPFLRRNGLL